MRIDRDAVLWSAPERERAGRPLLVLLHGFGSHEGDLFSLSPGLPLGPVVAALRAPVPAGPGFAWFSLDPDVSDEQKHLEADAAAAAVLDWLDETASTSIGLLGFSQGGAIALQVMRLAPQRVQYSLVLSGFVAGDSHPGDEALAAVRPPVFWGRGSADPMIPGALIDRTDRWLPNHSTLDSRIYEGLGHSIANRELHDVNTFIGEQLR
jgi:phospholipase/carboxylesterase